MTYPKKYHIAVYIGYPLNKYEWGTLDKPIEQLAKKFKGRETGGGTGFGFRDVDCEFLNTKDASSFTKAVSAKYKGVTTSIMTRD